MVVFGATGITGRQVAAYLATRAAALGRTWAAAGRDAAKVERTLADVGVSGAEVITADVSDPLSLRAMAARAKVVLNLVGPYTRYGRPVIEACAAEGASYLDLTGEIPFARDIVDDFHAKTSEAGIKVVQISGFEALPPDLAVLLAAEAATERFGEKLAEVDLIVTTRPPPGVPRPSDLISGGTFQSLAAAAGDPNAERVTDPAALITDGERAERVRAVSPIRLRPRRGPGGAVIAPMAPAAFINPAVIQRTAALLDIEPFAYREGMAIGGPAPTLPLRYAAAGALAGTQAAVAAAAQARPAIRSRISEMLVRALPSSGFGPHPDRLEAWRWRMALDARTTGGKSVGVEIEARGHPGYLSTAKILGEAGLAIATEGETPARFGCVTPAVALGTESIPRFAEADMAIRLVD